MLLVTNALIVSVLSAGLLALAYHTSFYWVTYFALLPLLMFVADIKSTRAHITSISSFTFLHSLTCGGALWQEAVWAWFAVALLHALIYAPLGWVTANLPNPTYRLVGLGLGWLGTEYISGQTSLWGSYASPLALGYSLAQSPLIKLSAISGVSTLSAIVLLGNLVLTSLCLRFWKPLVGAGFLVGGVLLYGSISPGNTYPAGHLNIAMIQPGIAAADYIVARFDHRFSQKIIDQLSKLSQKAILHSPDLTIWPEVSLPQTVTTLLLPHEFSPVDTYPLLLGAVLQDGINTYNAALFWDGQNLRSIYRKRYPVPLLEDWAKPGTQPGWLEHKGHRLGLLICSDAIYRDSALDLARQNVQALVVLANTNQGGAEMHLRHAAVRAAETGRWLVFVSQRTPSAVFNHHGKLLVRQTSNPAILMQNVTLMDKNTLFVRWGDWVGRISLFGIGSVLLALVFSKPTVDQLLVVPQVYKLMAWLILPGLYAVIWPVVSEFPPNSSYVAPYQMGHRYELGWTSQPNTKVFFGSKKMQTRYKCLSVFLDAKTHRSPDVVCGLAGFWSELTPKELILRVVEGSEVVIVKDLNSLWIPIASNEHYMYAVDVRNGFWLQRLDILHKRGKYIVYIVDERQFNSSRGVIHSSPLDPAGHRASPPAGSSKR